MPSIDLPLMVELVFAVLLVATLDCSQPEAPAAGDVPDAPFESGWQPEQDRHDQRILRLEQYRGLTSSPLA